jgi:hypothetical protein
MKFLQLTTFRGSEYPQSLEGVICDDADNK